MDMEYNEIIKYINFANDNNVNTFVLSGGEACLHKDFLKICKYVRKNRKKLLNIKKIIVQSNGYIGNVVDLKELVGFDYVHLSFDIDDNGLRKISSNHTIELAKDIKNNGGNVYLFTTIHKGNLNQLDEIVKCANNNKIDIAFNFCIDTGRDREFLLTAEEKKLAIDKLIMYEREGKINKLKNPYVNSYKKMSQNEGEFRIKGGCTAGIAACAIKTNGDVIPCPFLRVTAGNIHNDNLEDIWQKSTLFKVLRNRQKYDICGKCKYLSYCGGCRKSAYETSGSLNGYDKNCIMKGEMENDRKLANEC